MKRIACMIAAALVALPAAAQTEAQSVPTAKLVEAYTPLAGSERNATSLVEGLRTGDRVTLTSRTSSGATTTTSFTPPTGTMGNGNVDHALALAEASLKDQGITNPTPQQLQAALMGGSIRTRSGATVRMEGVLQMRADGMGWGQIAQKLGFRLGDVVSAGKQDARADRVSRAEHARADKPERPVRVERPDRPEKPQRPEKPERPGR